MIHTQLTLFIHTLKTHNDYEQNSKNHSGNHRCHLRRTLRRCRCTNPDELGVKNEECGMVAKAGSTSLGVPSAFPVTLSESTTTNDDNPRDSLESRGYFYTIGSVPVCTNRGGSDVYSKNPRNFQRNCEDFSSIGCN